MRQRRILTVGSLVVLLAILLGTSAVLANGQAKASAGAPGYASLSSRHSAAGPPVSTRRFTLEFVDAELVDVFQALATQSGVNVACSGNVKGKTTLRLRNVTLDQALNIVTKLNGMDYAWVDAAYVIGTPEEVRAMRVSDLRTQVIVLQNIRPEQAQEVLTKLTPDVTVSTQKGSRTILLLGTEASLGKAQIALAEMDKRPPLMEPPTTQVVAVRYLRAEEAAQNINAALPGVKVQPGTQPNSLLITADAMQWESVRSMLSAMDVAPAPAQATQAIYYVKYTSPSELQSSLLQLLPDVKCSLAPRTSTPSVQKPSGGVGGTAQLLAGPQYTGGSGGGGGGGSRSSVGAEAEAAGAPVTALILSGAPWTVERALEILEDLDVAPRQVHIAAMITEVERSDVSYLGIDWSGQGTSAGLGQTGIPLVMGEPIPTDFEGDGTTIPAKGLGLGKISRNYLQWTASIRALEQQGRARILSNPSVTTLDGRQTSLHTGETYYYEVAVAAATGGGVVKDIRTFDVGISLIVNPHINSDDQITLTISPVVAALQGTSEFSLPVVTERAVLTTVRVKNGETAVIAGLVADTEQVTIKKIPFLGDMPILGELFKHREKRPQHREVLVFVTPTIMGDAT